MVEVGHAATSVPLRAWLPYLTVALLDVEAPTSSQSDSWPG